MKIIIVFLFSFLFAFKNELYFTILKNNNIIKSLDKSIYNTQIIHFSPKVMKIINVSPDKFIVGNAKIDSKGNKHLSIGMEFDLQKQIKKTILVSNRSIFRLDKYFQQNSKIIKCYKNRVLFNLKLYFIEAKKFDNFYAKFIPLLKDYSPCFTTKNILFFKLQKEKSNFYPILTITKKRKVTSNFNINLNQDTSTYISASFYIKIPLQKSYDEKDISKLQNLNSSLNKINLLILKINHSIDNYDEILQDNKKILEKLRLLTIIAKVAPANLNYDKLITLYENFFKNLQNLNNLQRDIFINKFLLKIEKRKISEY